MRSNMTTRLERISYGGFSFGQNIMYMLQIQFLAYFYTEEVGLTIGATSLLLLIAKIWDAVNDPIIGVIVDKLNLKNGKYIPWLKAMSIIIPLTMLFTFMTVDTEYSIKLAFAYFTYMLWGMAYTFTDIPIFSLATVMSSRTYERDQLIAYGRMWGAVAAIATALFMTVKGELGWTAAVAIYCFVSMLTMLPLSYVAKERVKINQPAPTLGEMIKYLFSNKYLLIYYVGFFIMSSTNTVQTIAAYFANTNLGNEGLLTVILAVIVLPIVIASGFLPKLIKWVGKKKLTIYCAVLAIIFSIIQYFVGYENFTVFLIIAAIRILFMQIPLLLYGMFTADCIEYGHYKQGKRISGLSFSLQTMVVKFGSALSSSLALALLGMFGYVEQVKEQTELAKDGIWIIFSLIPIVGYIGMIVFMYFYRLDEKQVETYIQSNHR